MSVTVTWKNCVGAATTGGGDFVDGATGSSITASNNASVDATADDFGGSGHLVSQTASSMFTDPGNGDLTLKAGSSLINAGVDLSGSFTTDILENTRPFGVAFDIGAHETQTVATPWLYRRSRARIIGGGIL